LIVSADGEMATLPNNALQTDEARRLDGREVAVQGELVLLWKGLVGGLRS
jgi:hypothetical protein